MQTCTDSPPVALLARKGSQRRQATCNCVKCAINKTSIRMRTRTTFRFRLRLSWYHCTYLTASLAHYADPVWATCSWPFFVLAQFKRHPCSNYIASVVNWKSCNYICKCRLVLIPSCYMWHTVQWLNAWHRSLHSLNVMHTHWLDWIEKHNTRQAIRNSPLRTHTNCNDIARVPRALAVPHY